MYPHQWEPLWKEIRTSMGYDPAQDQACAELLDSLIKVAGHGPVADYAYRIVHGKTVRILGAGSGDLDRLDHVRRRPLIVAGSAVARAMQHDVPPDILVTDLDGDLEAHRWAAQHGTLIFVHAHGDNQDLVEAEVPAFPKHQVAGTCQVPAFGRLINPGGYTDGDRACYLAHALEARGAELLGFGMPPNPGPKLTWALKALEHLHDGGPFELAPWPVSPATHEP